LVLVLFTTLATSATGTSTKPTSSPTAGTSITVKPTTTVITANSTTSKATTSAHATVGRRKRDVDNGTLCLFPVYLVLY
jgi:hypothetical protein